LAYLTYLSVDKEEEIGASARQEKEEEEEIGAGAG